MVTSARRISLVIFTSESESLFFDSPVQHELLGLFVVHIEEALFLVLLPLHPLLFRKVKDQQPNSFRNLPRFALWHLADFPLFPSKCLYL